MKKIISLLLFLQLIIAGYSQQKVFFITSFGAKPDRKTINTIFIQKAIDKAAAAGGGKVMVPKGRFVTGVIWLKIAVEKTRAIKVQ